MIFDYNEHINFGQYHGLSVKEIYQGTLHLDRRFLASYIDTILNHRNQEYIFKENELIERYDVNEKYIKIIGEVHDPDKPVSIDNRVVFGDIQDKLNSFICMHFDDNSLGVLLDIRKFNKTQSRPLQIGGDPEYLEWCERTVEGFQISADCKNKLEKLPVARLTGIHLLFIGHESYEFAPQYRVEKFKFKENILDIDLDLFNHTLK